MKLREIAANIGGQVHGDPECEITRLAPLESAQEGDISFLANRQYRAYLAHTRASAVIIAEGDLEHCPVTAVVVEQVYVSYGKVAQMLARLTPLRAGRHESSICAAGARIAESAWIGPHSVVEDDAEIGERVQIGPGCVVSAGSRIGDDSQLVARVTICSGTLIGKRALLQPGVVIGADGFGFANDDGAWRKIPQLGWVEIGDDVEIGANTCVDRGALQPTRIGNGVKIDNLVQVAHNVVIGDHCAIAGCVGIAGSARIGKRCSIGGGAGILGHVDIVDDVVVTGMTFVSKSIDKAGIYSSGTPLEPNSQWKRNMARMRRLDEMARSVTQLEKRLPPKG